MCSSDLLALEGKGRKPKTITSNRCPDANYAKRTEQTSWNRKCTYNNCLTLEDFASILHNIHQQDKQAGLNAHLAPQTELCFSKGATPDKYDKVTTGYDKAALSLLGGKLKTNLKLEDDGPNAKHGSEHSTSDAMLFGKRFQVPHSVVATLEQVTKEEKAML